jgi:hypothetical protein
MHIQAQLLTYANFGETKPIYSVLMIHVADQPVIDFEQYIPNWTEGYSYDEDAYLPTIDRPVEYVHTKRTKTITTIEQLKNCVNCDVLIMAVLRLSIEECHDISEVIESIKPQFSIMVHQFKISLDIFKQFNTFIHADFPLIESMFALGWLVSSPIAAQFIGVDVDDIKLITVNHRHGVLCFTSMDTFVTNQLNITQIMQQYLQLIVSQVATKTLPRHVHGLYVSLNHKLFTMASYEEIIMVCQEFSSKSPSILLASSVIASNPYALIQITMLDDYEVPYQPIDLIELGLTDEDIPTFLRKNKKRLAQ